MPRAASTLLATLALCSSALAAGSSAPDEPADAPVFTGSSTNVGADAPAPPDLVVFKGTLLLNEFIYRAVLKLPKDTEATPQTAKVIAAELASFLGEAGYDLAKVRAQVKGGQIEVTIDEGALDKVIVVGTGWITAIRFRAALNLPLDVFNRRLFELQMPRLARQFGLRGYRYELWPVHLIETDNAGQLDATGFGAELRALPLIRPARGYELRIFAVTNPWSTGFSPEILLGGSIGYGVGGRYRWKDLIQNGDRWQLHFRAGAASRSHLGPDGGTFFVNSNDYVSGRWISKPWDGSVRGLRMTIAPRAELWSLQRGDLNVEGYRIGTLEGGTGAGAQLTAEFSLFFTLGLQRRWIYSLHPGPLLPLPPDVLLVPNVSSRGFLRMNSQYILNPLELRQDLRNGFTVELNAFRPTATSDRGYFRFDVQGKRILPFGWHELRAGLHLTGELGDVLFVDEIALEDHLRLGFGLVKYTKRVGSLSLEFRYSLLRDKVKVGLFNDLGVWRHLPRDDKLESPELAGSFGGGLFFFVFDELQIDAYYGVGWSTDGAPRTGLALAIKEAF